LPRVAYFSSTMTRSEVIKLENRVAELVFDQNPLAPLPSVDLGVIDWSAVSLGVDGQFVWRVPFDVLTYLGLGVAAHFQNGGGDAIDGTFVEDLLDSTVAGMNIHGGVEFPVTSRVRLYGDARYEFLGDLRFGAVRGGVQLMIGDPAPGESGS
jgi:opacity protein-like surface antigen